MQTFPSLFKKLNFAFFIVASFIVSFVVAANITSPANAATCSYSMTSVGNTINETCLPGPSIRTFTYSATDSTAITKAYLSGTGCSAQIQTSNSTSISSGTLYNNPVYSGVGTNCALGTSTSISISGGSSGNTTTPPIKTTSCVVDGVGWIVCSVTNFIAKVSDGAYSLIEKLVVTEPINTDISGGTNGLYNAWSYLRNIANASFVLAFMIITFSQLTSIGVSNYGVKKTLPRLIISAILVNTSYWIAAAAVDVSNILGKSIFAELSNIKNSMNITLGADNWNLIIGALLSGATFSVAGGAVVIGAAWAAGLAGIGMALLYLAIPLVAAALLAVFVFVFVLIARKALIIILILVSPLAFVAMLLPNTEKWFTKWRQTLISLLVLYPMLSIVYGGAQIAGLSLMSTASGGAGNFINTAITIITSQIIIVAPFFMLPSLIKKFSGANIDSMASNITSKGMGMINKGDKLFGISKTGTAKFKTGMALQKYGPEKNYSGVRGFAYRRGRAIGLNADMTGERDKAVAGEIDKSRKKAFMEKLATDGDYQNALALGDEDRAQSIKDRYVAAIAAEELKDDSTSIEQSLSATRANNPTVNDKEWLLERARNGETDGIRRAATHAIASRGMDDALVSLRDRSDQRNKYVTDSHVVEAIQANRDKLKDKAPDFYKGNSVFENFKGSDVHGWSESTAERAMNHIKSLSGEDRAKQEAVLAQAIKEISDSGLRASFDSATGQKIRTSGISIPELSLIDAKTGRITAPATPPTPPPGA